MNETQFRKLLDNYITGSISRSEQDLFFEYLEQEQYLDILKQVIEEDWQNDDSNIEVNPRLAKLIEDNVINRINQPVKRQFTPGIILKRFRIAAAAAILLLVAITIWLLAGNGKSQVIDQFDIENSFSEIDIQPGMNGAILTLDNGQQIVLDSAGNGLIANQGNTKILKGPDGLSYLAGTNGNEIAYNTITTPRGRQYPNLILSDGSKVWLDAGSSIRFPTSFSGNERKVWITGQVWFEVMHNSVQPFKVMANGVEIIDLGTQFNVNAYDDEELMKVTLLKGAVRIQDLTLTPGDQALISSNTQIKLNSNANLEEVIAWKNGLFNFHDADIKTVMRQLSRWYDVEVHYAGNIPDQKFNGEIGRNLTLKEILEGLAFTNIKFKIGEGRKLTILP